MMRITQRIAERNKDYYDKKPVTIVCLGDSVTHGCFDVFVNRFGQVDTVCDTPAGYPMLLQKALLRLFPFSAVNVINAGISGDSTTGALKRFDRDVAPFHPDLVTVNLGLNDCCAADPEAALANYMSNLRAIFRKIDELGAESMLVTPNMMCAYVDPSLEAEPLKKVAEMVAGRQTGGVLTNFVDAAREIARESGAAVADMLDDLKHGNKFYTGVETDKGVLLFSRNYEGNHQYGAFMEANIERHFFEPDFEGRPLTVYELRGWPSLMAGKINRCYDDYDNLLPLEKIPSDAFLDKSALKSITDKEVYDLSPTWENYARLTDSEKGLGLLRSMDNYDRMTLLYIMDKGYPMEGLTNEYPDNFSFHENFEKIEGALLGRNRWNIYDEMQEKARKLAGKLLREHFPNTWQKVATQEKEVLRNSKSIQM